MRASSSWIKLQFVVRKHVMNTYQMHTLSLFLFYHIFSTSLSLPKPCSLIFFFFCLFDSTPRLYSSFPRFFWWSVILMWHIQLYCIMYPFVLTCVCICVCTHFLGAYIYVCYMYMRVSCDSTILLLLFLITCLCLRPLAYAVDNCV